MLIPPVRLPLCPCVRCMLSLPLGGDRIGSHVHGAGSQTGSAYPPGPVVPALAFKTFCPSDFTSHECHSDLFILHAKNRGWSALGDSRVGGLLISTTTSARLGRGLSAAPF